MVRVGNASGYWGDDPDAPRRQLTQGPLEYLTLDFLAEVTMSILQKQRSRNAELGYATDFVHQMRSCLPILENVKTRLITNAGGINPHGCAREIAKLAGELGVSTKIAVIDGDDLVSHLDSLLAKGIPLKNMETGEELSTIRDRVEGANAYLGAAPIIRALEQGAQIIITGRIADASLAAAPPAFEFGWSLKDWDRLAAAAVAGHILECGAQASGGNLTDWQEVPSFLEMGYPIAEFLPDGTFFITKHENTGGQVDRRTVTEQLVYEIGDPCRYITPDVIADFSTIALSQQADNRVKISGVRGQPPTDYLKISISYHRGYKAHGTLLLSGPRAIKKSRTLAEIFWKRLGLDFEATSTELVGHDAIHRHRAASVEAPEVLLRLGVRDLDREKIEEFARKFPSLLLSSTPATAIVGGRPRVQGVIAYWPSLVPAREVTPEVSLLETGETFQVPWTLSAPPARPAGPKPPAHREIPARVAGQSRVEVPLIELCYARSGDKGNTCNIGGVARSEPIYKWLLNELTEARVQEYFGEQVKGTVERFELPNLLAVNFLLHDSLGGGGTVSLRIDPQGKTLAGALLMMKVDMPQELELGGTGYSFPSKKGETSNLSLFSSGNEEFGLHPPVLLAALRGFVVRDGLAFSGAGRRDPSLIDLVFLHQILLDLLRSLQPHALVASLAAPTIRMSRQ